MDNEFRFEVRDEGPDADVGVFGDFDMIGVLKLETELSRLMHRRDLTSLTLDLGGLQFIDSTALGLLLDLDQRAKQGEFEFRLRPGPRHVQRVFEVTQLAGTLPFAEEPGDGEG